jgi:hypothetical protein
VWYSGGLEGRKIHGNSIASILSYFSYSCLRISPSLGVGLEGCVWRFHVAPGA